MLEYTEAPLIQEGATNTGSQVTNFREIRVGAGENMFGFNGDGGWMGASSYQNAKIKFDIANGRILVSDGTNDRILIGKATGMF